jgi:flagellin
MPGIGGLSVADNLLANSVSLNLDRTQAGLQRSMMRLSSGLRINSAGDDPSGLSIAENLTSQVNGYDQGSRNVQDANNAATVAEGALGTIKTILQRVRQLAVEASSDILSQDDRQSLQDEVNQLLLEINRIAQNTNFNGRQLLDGSIAGYQPGQDATITVESNSTLTNAGVAPNSGNLVASAGDLATGNRPTLEFSVQQAATASANPQTIQVSDAQYLQAGGVYAIDGGLITVNSVDAASGTVNATLTANVNSGDIASSIVNSSITAAVGVGQQVVTLSGGAQPIYGGQVLQIDYGSFATNESIVVEKVLGSNTFLTTFTKPHGAGAGVYFGNEFFVGAGTAGSNTYTFGGAPTDGAVTGETAYVVESAGGGLPDGNGTHTQVVDTGAVTGGSVSSTTIQWDAPVPNLFGGWFEVWTGLGYGSTPVVNQTDGTIQMQVVDNNGTAQVQTTFYDTAGQTATVSPYFLNANESGALFDGVATTVGNISLADVGQTSYIKVTQPVAPLTNSQNGPLAIQAGPEEGSQIQVGIAAMDTGNLRISNTNLTTSLGAEDGIGQIDYALNQALSQSAQIGAIIVRMSEESDNNNIASVNLASSESNIMDLNVSQETTSFTKLQILGQVGTSVLAQANTNAQSILALFR